MPGHPRLYRLFELVFENVNNALSRYFQCSKKLPKDVELKDTGLAIFYFVNSAPIILFLFLK